MHINIRHARRQVAIGREHLRGCRVILVAPDDANRRGYATGARQRQTPLPTVPVSIFLNRLICGGEVDMIHAVLAVADLPQAERHLNIFRPLRWIATGLLIASFACLVLASLASLYIISITPRS
jgi:hypothetical protein